MPRPYLNFVINIIKAGAPEIGEQVPLDEQSQEWHELNPDERLNPWRELKKN
jgi:hypothetical protein